MNPLVSVIVPVYNTEESYLSKCVDSLLGQTLEDLEIILVDDGSTNSCGKICDEYSKLDSRVVVIHQENAGVSVARNKGINIASGRYVTFVDSDDWCDASVLKNIAEVAEKSGADIVLFGGCLNRIGTDGKERIREIHLNSEKVKKKEFLLEACCFPRNHEEDFILAPYSKLFRKDFLKKENLCFPQGVVYGEDRVFTIKAFYGVFSVTFCDEIGYHYRINNENQATSRYMPKLTESFERQLRLMRDFIDEKGLGVKCRTLLNTNNIVVLFESVFPQAFFHPDNPCDCRKRFKSFATYMEMSFVREILEAEVCLEYLKISHKIALWLCRKHIYWPFRLIEMKWNLQRKLDCWK